LTVLKQLMENTELMRRITPRPDEVILVRVISAITKDDSLAESFLKTLFDRDIRSSRIMSGYLNALGHYPPSETRDALSKELFDRIDIHKLNNSEVCEVLEESCNGY